LRRQVLFDGLSDSMIRDIVRSMYKIVCNPEDIIIRQGEYGDAYFVVESGKFHVIHQENQTSNTKIVGECNGGDAFGEGSLLYSIPRGATLKTVEKALVWALDAIRFIEIRQKISKEKNEKVARIALFLKRIELFKSYNEYDINEIAQAIKARNYKRGEIIIQEGDDSKEFYILRKGLAEIRKKMKSVVTYKR